ncbi:MAG: DUF5996 family protein [Chloroflexota bacterium]
MLPFLQNTQPTLHNLYSVGRLVGALRQVTFEKQPNFLHLGMKIVRDGVSTDVLPNGGEVTLDMREVALVYQPAQGAAQRIALEGQTQAALLEKLLETIYAQELAGMFPYAADETYTEALFKAAGSRPNYGNPSREHTTSREPLHFDDEIAYHYRDALYSIFTSMARFRARLNGAMTPLVVWPEHFDISFIWFAGDADESHPHLNFGFAPYSAGIDEPYLYAYAYPYPARFEPPMLPEGARWHTEGWTGVVLPYAEIAQRAEGEASVEASYTAIYRALRPLITP